VPLLLFAEKSLHNTDTPFPHTSFTVYDHILPQSIAFRPSAPLPPADPDLPSVVALQHNNVMPLITFLRENADKQAGTSCSIVD